MKWKNRVNANKFCWTSILCYIIKQTVAAYVSATKLGFTLLNNLKLRTCKHLTEQLGRETKLQAVNLRTVLARVNVMVGLLNMSSSAAARVSYELWTWRSTFLPMGSPSIFTLTKKELRNTFPLLSWSLQPLTTLLVLLVPLLRLVFLTVVASTSEAVSLEWLDKLFILKALIGGHPTNAWLLPHMIVMRWGIKAEIKLAYMKLKPKRLQRNQQHNLRVENVQKLSFYFI